MHGWLNRSGIPIATWLAGAALALLCAPQAAAQTPSSNTGPPTVSVLGEGEASGAPDVAYVSVGVQTQGSTAAGRGGGGGGGARCRAAAGRGDRRATRDGARARRVPGRVAPAGYCAGGASAGGCSAGAGGGSPVI